MLGQKVLTLIKIEMLFGGISDYLLLSPEWEGISNSVQRSVLVRGRENRRTSGARGWKEGRHTEAVKSKTSSTQSHALLGVGPWNETVF